MKNYLIVLATACLATSAMAGPRSNSFAIVVDQESYSRCTQSIDAYCKSVREDGLDAFVACADWTCPEQVKDSLKLWHSERSLEGAVFVGDIPIPMIRRAQFLTSAFKMDENYGEWRDNSVPSDRFYDDFDLDFQFISRDSTETLFFYYNLTEKGSQVIDCDIYTARIKPSSAWEDKYVELDNYFRKLVAIREEKDNRLDRVTSFTGEGSFSNSMIAWFDETRTLGEQLPDIYKDADGARFYVFHQQPLMKDMLLQAACEDDSDFYVFHCHGTPDRQWIGGYLTSTDFEDPNFEPQSYDELYAAAYEAETGIIKYRIREQYRRMLRYRTLPEDAAAKIRRDYGFDSTWFAGALDPKVEQLDSTLETRCGILLSDVQRYDTDSRVVLFDACYNGDFREDDNIATRYIMGHGKTVVGLGNSVNVLQDKVSEPLLGMLAAGYSVGQWQQQVNILESHIIGDPTFRFAPSYNIELPELSNKDCAYWRNILSGDYPADIKGLALQKLVLLNDPDAITLIHDTYCGSDSYCLRLQAMLLSLHFDSPLAVDVLVRSLDDPYEFIRRKAAHFLSLRGEPATIPALVECYFRDYNAHRVQFNISNGACQFEGTLFRQCFEKEWENQKFVANDETFAKTCRKWLDSAESMSEYLSEAVLDNSKSARGRARVITSLRNMPLAYLADDLTAIVKDPAQDLALRMQCADVLGWYNYAWNRASIISNLEAALPQIDEQQLSAEVRKSIKRLKAYTR